jgi:two-component system, sensor histidine kinase
MNDQTQPPAGAAAALLAEARAHFESDLAGARERAARALELARAEADGGSAAEAHMLLGECHRVLGDHAASVTSYGEGLEAARAAGDRPREAEAHRLMAFLHDSIGRFEEAHAHHLAALGLLEALGDERGMAHVLRTIGVSASKSRDHEQGLEWYRRSLVLARRAGDEESVSRTLTNIGLDLKNLGRLEESLVAHEEAVAISRRLGKRRSLASQLGNFAHTLALLKRDAEAESVYREAIVEGRALDYPGATGNALVGLGRLFVRLGRLDEARALLNEGLALAERANFRPDVADALEALVLAEKRAGDPEAALGYYERFHQLTRAIAQDESRSRLKGLELRLRVDQAQREATEQRRRSHELAEANERLQAAAAEKNDLLRLLQRQTREDALTGLANRRHFDERLSAAFAEGKRNGTPLALALIDIDHFQRLTDSYSQAAGDSTLLEVARILRAHVGEADLAARIGPETFALLFAACDLDTARRACDAIRAEVEAHDWAMIHQWLKVTVSMGVAQAGPESAPERLLTEADMRLRTAKEAGRNRVFSAPFAPPPEGAAAVEAAKVGLPDPRRALILAEQVRSSYQNLSIAYAAGLVGATLLCFVVRDLIPARVWALWLAAMFAVSAGLGFLYRAYRRAKPTGEESRRWGHYATTGALLAGSLWGLSAPLLHTPDSIDYQIMVASTAAIVGSSVAFASATYLPPFFLFFFPAVVPTAIVFLSKTDNTRFVIGLMLLLYLPIVTRFAVTFNRAFIETLRLRFQNVALVGELRERKDSAERANLAKSRFLAAASHDLRQPMHALGLFLQALRQGKLAERERKLVDNIGESFDAMDGLFNALLDISRLDAGVVEPRPLSFPVARLLDRMRTEYGPQAARKGLALTVHPCREFVRSDPVLLEEIVGNLLSNAIRYTAAGRVVLGCRRAAEGTLRIEVWDTGRGIPPDKLREVFREFIQLDNPERDREKGLGLGLAIVERLAELMGHPVDVRSTLGRGSVFRVRVPLGEAEDAVSPDRSEDALGIASFDGRFAVIVDDDCKVLEAMEQMLTGWGFEVAAGDSGALVLAKLGSAARRPDLILCDYRLRNDESGIEVIRAIRDEFNAEIPAALITGDTGPERLKEARASGLPLLHKPVKASRMRALATQLLREASAGTAT